MPLMSTVDLFEEKNMNQVVVGLLALGRQSQRVPGYTGPTIGMYGGKFYLVFRTQDVR